MTRTADCRKKTQVVAAGNPQCEAATPPRVDPRHTSYLSFLLHKQDFRKPNFTLKKTTKDTKNTKNVSEKVKCMQFFNSIWKNLHLTGNFYTGRIFENQILHPKKRQKTPKTLKMSLKSQMYALQFFHSIWKNLHLTEIFYTGTAGSAGDKYEV